VYTAGGGCVLAGSLFFVDDSGALFGLHFSQILSSGLKINESGCWRSLSLLGLTDKSIAFYLPPHYKKMKGKKKANPRKRSQSKKQIKLTIFVSFSNCSIACKPTMI
jgi:hypothetical protein